MLHGPLLGGAVLEALLGLILCLPLPAAMVKTLVKLNESIPDGSTVTITHRCLLAVVASLLLEALWDLSTTDADTAVQAERYYRALATVYLAGFTLLMTIMVKRLFVLTVASMRSQLDKDVMAKQAKNQAEQAEMVAKMLAEQAGNKAADATPQTKAEPAAKPDASAARELLPPELLDLMRCRVAYIPCRANPLSQARSRVSAAPLLLLT